MAKTILIVEDDPNISELVQMYLEKEGYNTRIASDGGQGLDLFRQLRPDLVLLDIMLPVMDGWNVLRTIRQDSKTPVIMLTAKNLEEHRAEGYEHGADSYITKPFHGKVLLARIDNLLKQRKLLKHVYQRAADVETEVEATQLNARDKQFVKQLNAIIQQHLSDCDFGVEDIGKEIGLSRVQLYRKVKAMTGSSVVDILRKARLAKGKRLLESRSMTIAEVAYEVGFSAPSYFTKCFKDEYGMLPGDIANS